MMKILVPVDFSDGSKIALKYASSIAGPDSRILVMHAILMQGSARANLHFKDLETIMMMDAETSMFKLLEENREYLAPGIEVTGENLMSYSVSDAVKSVAAKFQPDLILMGMKGCNNFQRIMFGSNAIKVSENTEFPLLLVPESGLELPIKKLTYASDLENLEPELRKVVSFAERYDAKIEILHMGEINAHQGSIAKKIKSDYPFVTFTNKEVKDTYAGIHDYLSITRPNLLVCFRRNRNFFEKIFEKSVSKAIAYHEVTPILIFKK